MTDNDPRSAIEEFCKDVDPPVGGKDFSFDLNEALYTLDQTASFCIDEDEAILVWKLIQKLQGERLPKECKM